MQHIDPISLIKVFLFCFLCLLSAPFAANAAEVRVVSQIERDQNSSQPLDGTIFIIHNPQDKINPSSFQIEGIPLPVEFLKQEPGNILEKEEAQNTKGVVTSQYRFRISKQPAGLHLLPSISVTVQDKIYKSAPSTYSVSQAQMTGPLNLQADIIGKVPLYPGQRAKMNYRIFYQGTIDLIREQLPLLDAKGLQKIGGIDVKEYTYGEYNVQEITQEVQALQPGKLSFPSSVIEGWSYQYVPGEVNPAKTKVRAFVSEMQFEVLPFPEAGKPPSFNGALGQFTYQVRLLSSPELNLGDTINIEISASGKGEIESLALPEISCQPGFSGFFDLGDLPPGEKNEKGFKIFRLDLRPLSTLVQQIPSIEFSSFDPNTQKYFVARSAAVPITVTTLKTDLQQKMKLQKQQERLEDDREDTTSDWNQLLATPPANQLIPNKAVDQTPVWHEWLETWYVFFLIPLGILALLLQTALHRLIVLYRNRIPHKGSSDYLQEAKQLGSRNPSAGFNLIEQALLAGLKEKGYLATNVDSADDLPFDGISGSIRTFLHEIDSIRFGGQQQKPFDAIFKEAKQWYSRLMEGGTS